MSASHLRRQLNLAQYAHRMRLAPSEPERVLWLALRAGQLGAQFRRQVILHGYIVDFFAPAARLVVEVDGTQHGRQRGGDGRRDQQLAALGLRVLRLEAQVVLSNLGQAVACIRVALGR